MLIPALASWLLPRKRARTVDPGSRRLEAMVARTLRRPFAIVLAVAMVLVAAGIWVLRGLGTELLAAVRSPGSSPCDWSGRRASASRPPRGPSRSVEGLLREAGGEDVVAVLSEVGRLPEDDRSDSARSRPRRTRRAYACGWPPVDRPPVRSFDGDRAGGLEHRTGCRCPGRSAGRLWPSLRWERSGPPVVVEIYGRTARGLAVRRDRGRRGDGHGPTGALERRARRSRADRRSCASSSNRDMADGLGVDLDTVTRGPARRPSTAGKVTVMTTRRRGARRSC